MQKEIKLKKLIKNLEPCTILLSRWLEQMGISKSLRQEYVKNGWLTPLGRGAYKRFEDEKEFLIGFASGQPDWSLCPVEVLKNLPAVRWKIINIKKLVSNNPKKLHSSIDSLRSVLKMD